MKVKKPNRFYYIVILILLGVFLIASPVLAIGNPNTISFGTGTLPLYKVFENVLETGDMLFIVESYVYYAVTPTDYGADESFLFEVLNTTGTVTLLSTPLNEYGDRPISIYQMASQVTALGLTSGTAYGLRITGNPLIFASPIGNTVTTYLTGADYVDQLLGVDGGVADQNLLRNYLIKMADNMEANDSPAPGDEYIVTIQGIRYLTTDGGDIFMEGTPMLSSMCPILFQTGFESMTGDTPESTGTYAETLTPAQKWGETSARGLTMLGSYLGINQALAGSVVLFGLVLMFAVFLYRQTQSGIAVLLLVAATPFMGAYLGLMPQALAFILTIAIVLLVGYFFFSRGAL